MRFQSYLDTAAAIIAQYGGEVPLAVFLKKFLGASRKYGSTDRRQISSLCYQYYRLGKALPGLPVKERIATAHFLCSNTAGHFLAWYNPEWNEKVHLPLTDKIKLTGHSFAVTDIFPWKEQLSEGIDPEALGASCLQQPLLFGRIRPGKAVQVRQKLTQAGIPFSEPAPACIALENATKLDAVLALNTELVIQDYNSQRVLDHLPAIAVSPLSAWDCCAASGGKSILLYDSCKGAVKLTVSDIRDSVLANLKKRFAAAGIKSFSAWQADLADPSSPLPPGNFDLIICDAPCSGSGTWARTPEQLFYFDMDKLPAFSRRQQAIVSAAIPRLKKGGLFFYITCSVFKEENEKIVDFIKEKFHLQCAQMELLKGYPLRADNMFVAVFTT